tara:strand:- start:842 stop:1033 length:192 start_codon:yes stop_codon:yes gene_type:complete
VDVGKWVKVKDEDDYFLIKSIDQDRGYVELSDITGHTWHCAMRDVERTLTNEELYIEDKSERD